MEYNVFSAFNGIGTAAYVLQKIGRKVNKFYAAAIDPRANYIASKNYPKTIHYGDITKIRKEHFFHPINFMCGGSPCQDLSIAGKMAGLNGSRSKLFFEFIRLWNEFDKPLFFFENVRMTKVNQDKISELFGCEPIYFDSELVSAQTRKRLYWTNIVSKDNFIYPKDRNIILNDILEYGEDGYVHEFRGENHKYRKVDKASCIDANYFKGIDNHQARTAIKIAFNTDSKFDHRSRVYDTSGKCPTITAVCGGDQHVKITTHSSQPRNGKGQGGKGHLQKEEGKAYCIDTTCTTMVEYADTYRKLTPIEVERCFSLPDNYTKGISNSARYHGLGNGWEAATIEHFFNYLPE